MFQHKKSWGYSLTVHCSHWDRLPPRHSWKHSLVHGLFTFTQECRPFPANSAAERTEAVGSVDKPPKFKRVSRARRGYTIALTPATLVFKTCTRSPILIQKHHSFPHFLHIGKSRTVSIASMERAIFLLVAPWLISLYCAPFLRAPQWEWSCHPTKGSPGRCAVPNVQPRGSTAGFATPVTARRWMSPKSASNEDTSACPSCQGKRSRVTCVSATQRREKAHYGYALAHVRSV